MTDQVKYKRTVSSGPATEPVTTAEQKTYMFVTGTDHDTLIANLIKAARLQVEYDFDAALITQTLVFTFDKFPAKDKRYNPDAAIVPIVYPIQSISSITYIDPDGNSQTWDAANYTLEKPVRMPHRIVPAFGVDYPQTRDQPNAITVTLVAGFGNAASDVPENIRLAIQSRVKKMYDNPEDMHQSGPSWNTSARQLLNNVFPWGI